MSTAPSTGQPRTTPGKARKRQGTHEYFSEGLTEEMITQLGRWCADRLAVVARTSSMLVQQHRARGVKSAGRCRRTSSCRAASGVMPTASASPRS